MPSRPSVVRLVDKLPLGVVLAALLLNLVTAKPAAASGTFTAVASGDWTDPAAWAGGVTPPLIMTPFDFVQIPAGFTITISPATTVTDGGTILNQGGLVVGGTLNVQRFLTDDLSSLTVSAGGALSIGGVAPVILQNSRGSTVTNHGTLNVTSGGQLMNQVGSLVANDGVLEFFGGSTINNLDVSRIRNDAGGIVTSDAGAIFLNRAQIANSGSFVNQPGSNLSNYGGFTNFGSLTNHGVFDDIAGGVVNLGVVGNDGTLTVYASNGFLNLIGSTLMNAAGGTLTVRGGAQSFVNQGTLVNDNGGTLLIWTAFVNNHGILANHGRLETQTVATLTNDASGVITNYADGTLTNGPFSVIENGDSSQGFGSINSYGPLTNQGQLHVTFGIFHQYAPGAITNAPGGSITISGSSSAFIIDGGATLTNARFGSITNAALLETISGTIQNHGTINNVDPGFLLNNGSVLNYCGDGASVTGRAVGNPVQAVGCTTTFAQTGIPSATWGVTANGVHYAGSGPSIAVSGLTGAVNYGYDPTVFSGGTRYDCALGCGGSTSSGGSVSATYAVSYRVTYHAVGCPVPVPLPPDRWVAPGTPAGGSFPSTVTSSDDPPSILCVLMSDDRPGTISAPTTITAAYAAQYLLTVYNGGGGSLAYYAQGTSVALTADAVPGMVFIDWQVDSTQYPPFAGAITVTMDGPHVATAIYDTPAQATQSLLSSVNGMGLAAGATQSLDAKLNAAIASLGRADYKASVGQLSAFSNEVRARSGKTLTTAQAEMLAGTVDSIIAAITSSSSSR